MGGKEIIDEASEERRIELLTHEHGSEKRRPGQLRDGGFDVERSVENSVRHRHFDHILQWLNPAADHVSVGTTRLTTQPRAIDRHRDEAGAAAFSDPFPQMSEDRNQIGASIAGEGNRGLWLLKSDGVSK